MVARGTIHRIRLRANISFAGLSVFVWSVISPIGSAQAQSDFWSNVSFRTGAEYTSGDYGAAANTSILSVPFIGQVQLDSLRVRVSVPWIRIEGPGAVVGGTDGRIAIGPAIGPVTTQSGIGDVVASISYGLPPAGGLWPIVELTGKVKFPTASDTKGLGTGKFDYTIQADIFQSLGRFTPFVTVGYRFRGDPTGLVLNNGVIVTAGIDYSVRAAITAGLIFDYREAATVVTSSAQELVPNVTWRPTDDVSINAYGIIGTSDGSPNGGGGLSLRVSL